MIFLYPPELLRCTTLVYSGALTVYKLSMAQKRSSLPKRSPKSARASISFPPNIYQELERLAVAKKVSIAWVVREAAEKYVAEQWPLFAGGQKEEAQ